ncbi:Macrophage colony-stimulating factor 1 receptor 2, partial [Goodea atripinnis]
TGNPSTVFVTPRSSPTLKEDDDFLFRCLLTDPSVTNLTLQPEDRGKDLPPGMNVTLDPRRGALITSLRMSFKGRYTCSGWKKGQEFRSKPLDLLVAPSKTPVCLFLCKHTNKSVFQTCVC